MSLLIKLALLLCVVSSVCPQPPVQPILFSSDKAQRCKKATCDRNNLAAMKQEKVCARHIRTDRRTGELRVDYYEYRFAACYHDDQCWNPTLSQVYTRTGECPKDIGSGRPSYRKLADKLPCPNSGNRDTELPGKLSDNPWQCRWQYNCKAWKAPRDDPDATFEQACFAFYIKYAGSSENDKVEYYTYTDRYCGYQDECWDRNLLFLGFHHCLRTPMPARALLHGRVSSHSRRPYVFGRE